MKTHWGWWNNPCFGMRDPGVLGCLGQIRIPERGSHMVHIDLVREEEELKVNLP